MTSETRTVIDWLEDHDETPGRVYAASTLPSDETVEYEVAAAVEGWIREDIASDREPIDLDRVDWANVGEVALDYLPD